MIKDRVLEGIVIGIVMSMTAFLGSSIIRTYRNEEKVYANEIRLDGQGIEMITIHRKIDKIYDYIINLDRGGDNNE